MPMSVLPNDALVSPEVDLIRGLTCIPGLVNSNTIATNFGISDAIHPRSKQVPPDAIGNALFV